MNKETVEILREFVDETKQRKYTESVLDDVDWYQLRKMIRKLLDITTDYGSLEEYRDLVDENLEMLNAFVS